MIVFMDFHTVPRWWRHMRVVAMVVWGRMPHFVVWIRAMWVMRTAEIMGEWG